MVYDWILWNPISDVLVIYFRLEGETIMTTHETLKKGMDKQGKQKNYFEIKSAQTKLLGLISPDTRSIDFFLNGKYLFDIGLYATQTSPEHLVRLFAGHIERQRGMEYPPTKGYFHIYDNNADKTPPPRPFNPLGMTVHQLLLFNDLLVSGYHSLDLEETKVVARRLLDWLGINPDET